MNRIKIAILGGESSQIDAQHFLMLRQQLAVHIHSGIAQVWSTNDIIPGMDRLSAMEKEIADIDILILLVSPDSLAIELADTELRSVIQKAARSISLGVILVLRPCGWMYDSLLMNFMSPERIPSPFILLPASGSIVAQSSMEIFYEFICSLIRVVYGWHIERNIESAITSILPSPKLIISPPIQWTITERSDVTAPSLEISKPSPTLLEPKCPKQSATDHLRRKRHWKGTVAMAAMAAAFVIILLNRWVPETSSTLPTYALSTDGDISSLGSASETSAFLGSVQNTHPNSASEANLSLRSFLRIDIRPDNNIGRNIRVISYIAMAGSQKLEEWPVALEHTATGAFRLRAPIWELPKLAPGQWELVFVVGIPPKLPSLKEVEAFRRDQHSKDVPWKILNARLTITDPLNNY